MASKRKDLRIKLIQLLLKNAQGRHNQLDHGAWSEGMNGIQSSVLGISQRDWMQRMRAGGQTTSSAPAPAPVPAPKPAPKPRVRVAPKPASAPSPQPAPQPRVTVAPQNKPVQSQFQQEQVKPQAETSKEESESEKDLVNGVPRTFTRFKSMDEARSYATKYLAGHVDFTYARSVDDVNDVLESLHQEITSLDASAVPEGFRFNRIEFFDDAHMYTAEGVKLGSTCVMPVFDTDTGKFCGDLFVKGDNEVGASYEDGFTKEEFGKKLQEYFDTECMVYKLNVFKDLGRRNNMVRPEHRVSFNLDASDPDEWLASVNKLRPDLYHSDSVLLPVAMKVYADLCSRKAMVEKDYSNHNVHRTISTMASLSRNYSPRQMVIKHEFGHILHALNAEKASRELGLGHTTRSFRHNANGSISLIPGSSRVISHPGDTAMGSPRVKKYAPTSRGMDSGSECMAETYALYSIGATERLHPDIIRYYDSLKKKKAVKR